MQRKALCLLAGVGLPLIAVGTYAGFVGIETVVKTVPPGTPGVAGGFVVNVYASFDRPPIGGVVQDRFIAAAGTPQSPMDIHVVDGTFYQHAFGGDTAPSAALIEAFPSLAFDTFVTIGAKKIGAPGGQNPPPLTLTPGWPGFSGGFVGGSSIAWANTPADPNTDPFNPAFVDGNGKILIGQFTTLDGNGIVGMFRILVTSNNVGTMLNVSFTSPPPPPENVAFFTDPSAFDAALVNATKAGKATWDFEPNNIAGPDGVALDDPLDIDTHTLDPDDPWGKLWPADVDNARFWANTTPAGPLSPRGPDALAFLTEGFLGMQNNVLAANVRADSFCIQSGVPRGLDHSAVGLELVNAFSSGPLTVTVYDPDENLLGSTGVSVTAGQPAFLGILGTAAIPTLGRVDVYDPAGGFEGVRSIALYRDNAVFFTDPGEFEKFNSSEGKALAGTETFEESNVRADGIEQIQDSLISHAPDVNGTSGIGFPAGLAQSGLLIQTNVSPGPAPADPNPSGNVEALFVVGPGLSGANSRKVGEFLFADGVDASLDVIVTEYCPWDCGNGDGIVSTPDFLKVLGTWGTSGACDFDGDGIVGTPDFLELLGHWGIPPQCVPPVSPVPTAVAFELSRMGGFPDAGWHVTIYDRDDIEIGQFVVPAPGASEPSKTFVGASCISTIGRINIFDEARLSLDAIDDIQLWE